MIALYWRRFLDRLLVAKLVVAFLPTALAGLALYNPLKNYLMGSELVVVCSLAIGGVVLIIFELLHKERPSAKQWTLRRFLFETPS